MKKLFPIAKALKKLLDEAFFSVCQIRYFPLQYIRLCGGVWSKFRSEGPRGTSLFSVFKAFLCNLKRYFENCNKIEGAHCEGYKHTHFFETLKELTKSLKF